MKGIKKILALLMAFSLTFNSLSYAAELTSEKAAAKVKVMMDIIMDRYVGEGSEEISEAELMDAAIKGMFDELDVYSEYYNRDEYKKFIESVSGKFGGIGVYINDNNGAVEVVRPIQGTPGFEAGFAKGDIIIKIEDEDVRGYSINKVVSLIRGDEGTSVRVTVLRGTEEVEMIVTRAIISVPAIEVKELSKVLKREVSEEDTKKIKFIQLIDFNDHINKELTKVLNESKTDGTEGIIFDVRDNPGGYLVEVVNILKQLVPEGPIIHTIDKDGNKETRSSYLKNPPFKIVVITNNASASASEIFTAAVKESGVGKVVGETTYGKGVVQEIKVFLTTGDAFKITMQEYLTRDENKINGIGIEPDYKVEVPTYKIREVKRLKLNDKADDVKRIKKMLKYLGYEITDDTDVYTKDVLLAIKKFQKEQGLFPYGVADFSTQSKLNTVVRDKIKEKDIQAEKAYEVMKDMLK
ncbi:MAG: S41 family peptidase [Clostridia bacterium]|jgi:carboxyl-terminal processing protease|nr:S41 family peptidase [Clostridia bacterium]